MLTLNGIPTEVYQDATFKGDVEISGTLNATDVNLVCYDNNVVAYGNSVVTYDD